MNLSYFSDYQSIIKLICKKKVLPRIGIRKYNWIFLQVDAQFHYLEPTLQFIIKQHRYLNVLIYKANRRYIFCEIDIYIKPENMNLIQWNIVFQIFYFYEKLALSLLACFVLHVPTCVQLLSTVNLMKSIVRNHIETDIIADYIHLIINQQAQGLVL